jgi:hypothetical protein
VTEQNPERHLTFFKGSGGVKVQDNYADDDNEARKKGDKKVFLPENRFFFRRKNCADAKKEISRPTFHPHDSRMASMEVLMAPRLHRQCFYGGN